MRRCRASVAGCRSRRAASRHRRTGRKFWREDGLLPPGPHLGEARILPDLQPPALIVGQVQVERIELVEREEVDDLFDELGWIVPACHVEEDAAIGEAGRVVDGDSGNVPARGGGPLELRREELPDGFEPVQEADRTRRRESRSARRNSQMVALRIRRASRSDQLDRDRVGRASWAGARDTGRGSAPPDAALSGAASMSASERRSAFAVSERKIRVALSSWNSPGLATIETGDGTMGYRSGAGFARAGTCVPAATAARSTIRPTPMTDPALRDEPCGVRLQAMPFPLRSTLILSFLAASPAVAQRPATRRRPILWDPVAICTAWS